MSTSASEIFDLRNFYFYQCGNTFTGSLNGFDYKIVPAGEEIKVQTWHGMLCSDVADIEHTNSFPLTEEGFENMVKWLENTYKSEK